MEGKAEADIGVGARDTAGVGVWVLLSLVKASGKLPTSSSSPLGGGLRWRLRQMRGPAI